MGRDQLIFGTNTFAGKMKKVLNLRTRLRYVRYLKLSFHCFGGKNCAFELLVTLQIRIIYA